MEEVFICMHRVKNYSIHARLAIESCLWRGPVHALVPVFHPRQQIQRTIHTCALGLCARSFKNACPFPCRLLTYTSMNTESNHSLCALTSNRLAVKQHVINVMKNVRSRVYTGRGVLYPRVFTLNYVIFWPYMP